MGENEKIDNIQLAQLSQKGYRLIKEGSYQEAIDVFTGILEQSPDNAYGLVGMGDTLRKQKRHTEAYQYYEKCLKNDPTNRFAIFGLADIMRHNQKYAEAIRYWNRYLLYDKDNVAIITRVADSYRRMDNPEKSREYYKRALQVEPDNFYSFIGLGWLHFGMKDFKNALESWLKVFECPHDEKDIRIYTIVGNCYYKLKDYKKSIEYYKMAEKREPNNFYVLFGLANCHRGLIEYERAVEYLLKIIEVNNKDAIILSRLGDAYIHLNKHDVAKKCYRQALDIKFDIFAAFGMARIAYLNSEYSSAIKQMVALLPYKGISTRAYHELETYAANSALSFEQKRSIRAVLNK